MSVSVVVLEPRGKCLLAFGVGEEGLPVGPFDREDAVEPLDLAVLPGAVWPDLHVLGPTTREGFGHVGGLDVVPVVVGYDGTNATDPMGGEVVRGVQQEAGAGRSLLVGQDLAIGQARVVIDY